MLLQPLPAILVVGHHSAHVSPIRVRVIVLEEVGEFMDDDVVNELIGGNDDTPLDRALIAFRSPPQYLVANANSDHRSRQTHVK